MKIKVCGMRESNNIRQLELLRPDFMGFIFYPPSSRFAGDMLDEELVKKLDPRIEKVGVFVNESLDQMERTLQKFNFRTVQLHGSETPGLAGTLREKGYSVIKVFSVGDRLPEVKEFEGVVDYFMFDTKTSAFGGSGKRFNWEILKNYVSHVPLFLSGGIGPESLRELKNMDNPHICAVDINSRFEISLGLKNIPEIEEFKKQLLEPIN